MYTSSPFLHSLGAFIILTSCSAQPTTKEPVVITNDTVPIPTEWFLKLDHEGQLCHWVRNMHQDRSGTLWFGTNHYGLIRYANDTLEYLADSAGITTGRINGIVEGADGILWVATDGEGLFRHDPSKRGSARHGFGQLTTKDGLLHDEIWSMAMGRDGLLWLGTMNGLCTYDGRTFTSIDLPATTAVDSAVMLSPTRITCILEDSQGRIWFGRDGDGLFMFDPKQNLSLGAFTHYTLTDGLPDNSVSDLMEDSKGRLWIGSMFGGVSLFDRSNTNEKGSGSFTNFTKDGVIQGVETGAFYEDRSGHIWFAAEHQGVFRYDGTSFTNYGPEDGMSSGGILAIMEDREGRFWFGGLGGLFRFDRQTTRFTAVTKKGPWEPL
jgi:ligand-binding sensor domain-containing protein